MTYRTLPAVIIAGVMVVAGLAAAAAEVADQPPPPLATSPAQEISRQPAAEATQGVAVDQRFFYAIANFQIAKYDKLTGAKISEWKGLRALTPHINACAVIERRLVCANSNYPNVPQTSSVEIFDPATMTHLSTVALGPGIGSLTWIDRRDGFWWAAFANYDTTGGEPGRDHRYTTLVKFDNQWRRLEGWLFPQTVLDRFSPRSSSGGGWGDDGLLYVTGHDRPELYALRLPQAGSVLEHVATISLRVDGQAIAWDRSRKRVLYGISRGKKEVVAMRIPELAIGKDRSAPTRP